ncbi:MAG: hypothetical protein Q9198_002412, partial [Flavoplaca austrocitrina]
MASTGQQDIPPHSNKVLYEFAQEMWKDVFENNAYTNFPQIQYLKDKAEVSWAKLLQDSKLLSKKVTKDVIEQDFSYENVLTWAKYTGRCTTFAVAVVRRLEEDYPGAYDFKYYDLGGHCVARCAKTGILIDSSSKKGAIRLKDGEWSTVETTIEKARPSWKWKHGTSKFEGTDGKRA